jgi:hypothetical protein
MSVSNDLPRKVLREKCRGKRLLSDLSITRQLPQNIPIWFEFNSGQRINLNSNVIIEDTTGLYQFLRHCGQRTIAKQINVSSRFVLVPRIHAPIVFYERDYHDWQL